MKKDFIVRRSITIVKGKPHVETYSEQELVRCKDCKHRGTYDCPVYVGGDGMRSEPDNWFCADGERRINTNDQD